MTPNNIGKLLNPYQSQNRLNIMRESWDILNDLNMKILVKNWDGETFRSSPN